MEARKLFTESKNLDPLSGYGHPKLHGNGHIYREIPYYKKCSFFSTRFTFQSLMGRAFQKTPSLRYELAHLDPGSYP